MSRSRLGAWIEIGKFNDRADYSNVAPVWERGLKSEAFMCLSVQMQSLPFGSVD